MKREDMYIYVKKIIQSVINEMNESIFSEGLLLHENGLELSSLDVVIIIVKIEDFFDIQWPDEYLAFSNITIGEILNIVEECILKKKGDK